LDGKIVEVLEVCPGSAQPARFRRPSEAGGNNALKFITEMHLRDNELKNYLTWFSQKALKALVVFAKTLDFSA
jgi:hypothetical protein